MVRGSDRPIIGFLLLDFQDPRLEYNYINQTDYMLKYSILLSWWVYLSLLYVQAVDHHKLKALNYSLDIFCFTFITLILFIAWYKQLCYWRYRTRHVYSHFSCCLFYIADEIQRNLIFRICIYMAIIIMYFIVLILLLVCS